MWRVSCEPAASIRHDAISTLLLVLCGGVICSSPRICSIRASSRLCASAHGGNTSSSGILFFRECVVSKDYYRKYTQARPCASTIVQTMHSAVWALCGAGLLALMFFYFNGTVLHKLQVLSRDTPRPITSSYLVPGNDKRIRPARPKEPHP